METFKTGRTFRRAVDGLQLAKYIWADSLPILTFILALVINGGLLFSVAPFPNLGHSIIFWWTVRFERAFSMVALFLVLIFYDTLYGRLLGITFFETGFFFLITLLYRPFLYHRAFWFQWLFFCTLVGTLGLCFVFFELLMGVDTPLAAFGTSFLWVLGSYPLVSRTLSCVVQQGSE